MLRDPPQKVASAPLAIARQVAIVLLRGLRGAYHRICLPQVVLNIGSIVEIEACFSSRPTGYGVTCFARFSFLAISTRETTRGWHAPHESAGLLALPGGSRRLRRVIYGETARLFGVGPPRTKRPSDCTLAQMVFVARSREDVRSTNALPSR